MSKYVPLVNGQTQFRIDDGDQLYSMSETGIYKQDFDASRQNLADYGSVASSEVENMFKQIIDTGYNRYGYDQFVNETGFGPSSLVWNDQATQDYLGRAPLGTAPTREKELEGTKKTVDHSKLANGLPPDDPSNQYNTATGQPNPNYNPAAPKPNTTNQSQTSAPTSFFSGANLSVGSSGPAVSQLQQALGGLTVDGKFGPKTLAAVKAYQLAHGLKVDGIVGPQTMAALNAPSGNPVSNVGAGMMSGPPPGWDAKTYENFKAANPNLEPNAEDTRRMQNINPPPPKIPVAKSPQAIVSDIHKESLKAVGASTIKKDYDNLTSEYEKLADKKIDETQDINNNPWYSEGVRVQKLRQLDAKYEGKELILSNKLKLAETMYDNAQRDAEFMTGQSLDIYQQRELFDQQNMLKGIEIAQSQWEAENKLQDTTDLKEYNFAKSQGYTGTFTQYQKDQANLKERIAKAGASNTYLPSGQDVTTKETSEALGTVNSIGSILSNPNFESAFGIQGLARTLIPGSAEYTIAAQVQQIKDKLSLAARGGLKGQGAVSNFEGLMLANAQTSLRTGMSPTDARQEFINIAGALTTSTGGKAKVQIKDSTGAVYTIMADSRGITQAIADGLSVKYVQ